jgi:plastocyanin
MLRNAIRHACIAAWSAMALMPGLTSDLQAAPAAPRSMSSLLHLDHAADMRAISAAADADTIVLKDFHFAPALLTVAVGTTVTWRNLDGEPHTVVSIDGIFRSSGLDRDDTFTFTFDEPGTYKFLCSIHSRMAGTIIVK